MRPNVLPADNSPANMDYPMNPLVFFDSEYGSNGEPSDVSASRPAVNVVCNRDQ